MISVIIRNFNNGNTIERAIKSALSQNLDSIEIIVIDDGSTDDSLNKIKTFKNIRFYQTKRLGAIKALNFALKKAKGKFYTILDGDDYLPPHVLAELRKKAEENPDAAIIYGDYFEINSKSSDKRRYSTKDNVFSTVAGGLLIKKDIARKLGFYDEALFFPEYDLLKKILKQRKIVHLPKIVYYYHRHLESLTANKIRVKNGIKQLEEKYGEKIPIRKY